MATPQKNPAWLDALLAQAYPGNQNDMSMFPNTTISPSQYHQGTAGGPLVPSLNGDRRMQDAIMNQQTGMAPSQSPGGYPVAGGDPRAVDAAMNMNTGMAPGSFGGTMVPNRAYAPPRPDPRNVGGAPSPGTPAPVGANRTQNSSPFTMVARPNADPGTGGGMLGGNSGMANIGGGARGGGGAPLGTALDLSRLLGGGQQQQQQPQQQPAGALTNPQGGGSGFNVAGLFRNLPNNIFDQDDPGSYNPLAQGGSYNP